MSATLEQITFVVAVNNDQILSRNFLASPCLQEMRPEQLLFQRGYASAAYAYNNALEMARNEIVIFAHQDMYFPHDWISSLERALSYLEWHDPNWGVLGGFGVTARKDRYGHVYSSGLGVIGNPVDKPTPVQTLDEIVLIVRKSSRLSFDTALNGFHFYGSDLCLQAAARGMRSYVIPGFCVHNTQMYPVLPPEFYSCYRQFKQKWRSCLPVHTSCITVSSLNIPFTLRRMREWYITHIKRQQPQVTRLSNPASALTTL
jgi:hypothetical protein